MAAEELDGDALRLAVIHASGDARVRAMLGAADVTVVRASARWEASHGAVQGYAVTVALCAEDLATVDAYPATRDLLERGFAVAVAASPDRSMTALHTRWNHRGGVRVERYRDIARTSVEVSLDEALRRYRQVMDGSAAPSPDVRLDEVDDGVIASASAPVDDRARLRIESALVSLWGARRRIRWSVR